MSINPEEIYGTGRALTAEEIDSIMDQVREALEADSLDSSGTMHNALMILSMLKAIRMNEPSRPQLRLVK